MIVVYVIMGLLCMVIPCQGCSEADKTLVRYIKWQMNERENCTGRTCKVRKTSYIAFHARLNTHLSNLASNAVVKFNEPLTDEGSAYDPNTGIFTCPEDGLYMFSWTLLTQNGQKFNSKLVVDSMDFAYTYADASKIGNHLSASQSAVVKLQKGQTVMVRTKESHGGFAYATWSSFSGYKI